MKRTTACFILVALLAGGWLTGKWLANSRTPREPVVPNVTRTHEPSTGAGIVATPSQSRDFNAGWAAAMTIPDREKRFGQLTLLCIDWVKVDPPDALNALIAASAADKNPDRTRIHSAFSYLFQSWAQAHGWDAAMAAAKTVKDSGAREFAMHQLGHEALLNCQRPRERLTELLAAAPEHDRTALLSSAMRMWGRSAGADPAEITAWIDGLPRDSIPADQLIQLERAAASASMVKNPRLAADWLLSRASPENRAEHLRSIVTKWVMIAPNACGEWLREQPFGPDMDHAIEFFSQVIVRDDAESAVQWASRISDPVRRGRVLQHILDQWKLLDPAAAAMAAKRMDER